MKIFSKYYARRLYKIHKLEDIIRVLTPWVDEVLYEQSPFLFQAASYKLRKYGSSYAPRFFKKIVAGEMFRLSDFEDLRASLFLAIVESFRNYKPSKGNTDLVTWLSWNIPYCFSKSIPCISPHPVGPWDELASNKDILDFEDFDEREKRIAIICSELGFSRQVKDYYLGKE